MSTRRRTEPPSTTALRPVELSALLQASAAGEGEHDPQRSTVEMLPLGDGDGDGAEDPGAELQTTEIIRLEDPRVAFRPTVELCPLAPPSPPPKVVARGSRPIPKPRITRRSVEMLRVHDLKPEGGGVAGGRPRKPTR